MTAACAAPCVSLSRLEKLQSKEFFLFVSFIAEEPISIVFNSPSEAVSTEANGVAAVVSKPGDILGF